MADRVSAAEKYAEGPRPLCECHGEAMRWAVDARCRAGGRWECASRYSSVSAAVKYAEIGGHENAPLCECHGVAMLWQAKKNISAGGKWCCVIRGRAAVKKHRETHLATERERRREYMRRQRAEVPGYRELEQGRKREHVRKRKLLEMCLSCGAPTGGWSYCEKHKERERQLLNHRRRIRSIASIEQQISSLTAELETIAAALGVPKEVFLEAVN